MHAHKNTLCTQACAHTHTHTQTASLPLAITKYESRLLSYIWNLHGSKDIIQNFSLPNTDNKILTNAM